MTENACEQSTGGELVSKSEAELWQEYIVMLARTQQSWQLYKEAWRTYVLTGLKDEAQELMYRTCSELYESWYQQQHAAYEAWKAVAYPQYGVPFK